MKAQIILTIETYTTDGSEQKDPPTPFQVLQAALPWFKSAVEGAIDGVNNTAEAKGSKTRARLAWETKSVERTTPATTIQIKPEGLTDREKALWEYATIYDGIPPEEREIRYELLRTIANLRTALVDISKVQGSIDKTALLMILDSCRRRAEEALK